MSQHLPRTFLWSLLASLYGHWGAGCCDLCRSLHNQNILSLRFCSSPRGICSLLFPKTGPWAGGPGGLSLLRFLPGKQSLAPPSPVFTQPALPFISHLQIPQLQTGFSDIHLKHSCKEHFSIPLLVPFPFFSPYFYFFFPFLSLPRWPLTCLGGLSSNPSFPMSDWYIKCHHGLASDLSFSLHLGTNRFIPCPLLLFTV